MRLGHEWCGPSAQVGDDVDPGWVGRRTTGDTIAGGGTCATLPGGRPKVCEAGRGRIQGRLPWPRSPSRWPCRSPRCTAARCGRRGRGRRCVETGGSAWLLWGTRCGRGSGSGAGHRHHRTARRRCSTRWPMAREVQMMGLSRESLDFALALRRARGVDGGRMSRGSGSKRRRTGPRTHPDLPEEALDLVEPGKRGASNRRWTAHERDRREHAGASRKSPPWASGCLGRLAGPSSIRGGSVDQRPLCVRPRGWGGGCGGGVGAGSSPSGGERRVVGPGDGGVTVEGRGLGARDWGEWGMERAGGEGVRRGTCIVRWAV